jgi:hypothetical protein
VEEFYAGFERDVVHFAHFHAVAGEIAMTGFAVIHGGHPVQAAAIGREGGKRAGTGGQEVFDPKVELDVYAL